MTLRHLRIFVVVYQEMSITKAAEKLHLAQPSVSLAVKELEEEYQIRLFDRINRHLAATEKGIRFYDYAIHILELTEEMDHAMTSPEVPEKLKIGSSITVGNFLMPCVVRDFHEKYSSCQVRVTIQNSGRVIQAVSKNDQDLGVVEGQVCHDQLVQLPFMEDRLYFLCGQNHPLAGKEKVGLDEICEYPLFLREEGSASREITEGLLKAYQVKGKICWESVSNQALIEAVKENPGITVLSGRLVEKELQEGSVRILPLYPKAFLRNFSLIYHRKKYLTEPLRYLMELFQKVGEKEKG